MKVTRFFTDHAVYIRLIAELGTTQVCFMLYAVYRLWILAESRVHLKDFEVQETELNETLNERVEEHKELEEKV